MASIWRGAPLLPLLAAGLAGSRLLAEGMFLAAPWLLRPLPALALALLLTAGGWGAWRVAARRRLLSAWLLLPLLLNLLWLADPAVDLLRSRLLFAASLWLTLALAAHAPRPRTPPPRTPRSSLLLLWLALLPTYLLTLGRTVGRADTFEFQVVVPQLGIAHPTGYPLYLLLGKLWTLLPVGSVAWRLNLGTAVYALAAASFLFLFGRRLLGRPLPALLGAVLFGLLPTLWSQAVEAEVYTLHALVIAAALWLMGQIGAWRLAPAAAPDTPAAAAGGRAWLLLALLLGLGLTNHLTTLFLLPALLVLLLTAPDSPLRARDRLRQLLLIGGAFLLSLTLYAYLPLRWAAVNGEPMGFGRFVDWVIGGRFQDALVWRAWLDDPTRYAIVGRLFLDNWGWVSLAVAGGGFVYLAGRRWPAAVALGVIWLGFTFYSLNYYVPDLAVFLLGAQVIGVVWWMAGVAAVSQMGFRGAASSLSGVLPPLTAAALFVPVLLLAVQTWPRVDRSMADGLTAWGAAVLDMPLAADSAILADSEKIAPLYYLQQAEGVRPDLAIMVLPDEAAYRAELERRVAAGQTVYLARFLPGLEGVYHLRAVGPLVEVSPRPLVTLPAAVSARRQAFGPIDLVGVAVEASAYGARETAVTLYWQAPQPVDELLHVYVRWAGAPPLLAAGQHPANNSYPTYAWDAGEVVPDFYRMPHPVSPTPQVRAVQVALAPPFTSLDALPWQTVAEVALPAAAEVATSRPLRAQVGATAIDGADFPAQIRPQTPLPVTVTGVGDPAALQLSLRPAGAAPEDGGQAMAAVSGGAFAAAFAVPVGGENGRYVVWAAAPGGARCGWLRPARPGCVLGEVVVSGAPLPAGATNFDDRIALLDVSLAETTLQPGGQLRLTLTWQGLAPLANDYTVFVQVLDENDQIVGQVDSWPVQGTRPTSAWTPGEVVTDPYVVPLRGDLPPGPYRLIFGWYLLGDNRRLPVLDGDGAPIRDHVSVPGLTVR